MRKVFFGLLAVISAGLFAWVFYLILSSPPEPAFGAANHNVVIARLDHIFRVAAYSVAWAIQLGLCGLAWLQVAGAEAGYDGGWPRN